MTNNIKLRVGQTVELNNGERHRVARMHGDDPLRVDEYGYGPFVVDGWMYRQDGQFDPHQQSRSVARIISEPDEPAYDPADDPSNPDKLPLREMSDRVIGMIVRAEPQEREWLLFGLDTWIVDDDCDVFSGAVYRIRRRTVRIEYDCDENGKPIMETGREVG